MAAPTSDSADDATTKANTTGVMTSILELSPDRGLAFILAGSVPIYAKLKDSNGNDLPLDTNLAFRYDAPSQDSAQVISEELPNIQPFNGLTIAEQQSDDYRANVVIDLQGQAAIIRDVDTFEIAIESDTQIDWSESELYIEPDAIEEVSEDALN